MALTKVYRATWSVDGELLQFGANQTTESAAEADLISAESTETPYTSFWGTVEVFWIVS